MSKDSKVFVRAMSKRGKGDDIGEIKELIIDLKRKIDQDVRMGAISTIEYGANVKRDDIVNIINGRYKKIDNRVIYKLSKYYGLTNHHQLN